MHPVRRRRILVIFFLLLILSFAASLIMYALRQNINLFFSPSQILQTDISPNQLVRLGGLVVVNSVKRDSSNLHVSFKITDNQNEIAIDYNGILPDLFREGQSIVTQGYYLADKNYFKAIEVLAKHDEKYMPTEVKDSLLTESLKYKREG